MPLLILLVFCFVMCTETDRAVENKKQLDIITQRLDNLEKGNNVCEDKK